MPGSVPRFALISVLVLTFLFIGRDAVITMNSVKTENRNHTAVFSRSYCCMQYDRLSQQQLSFLSNLLLLPLTIFKVKLCRYVSKVNLYIYNSDICLSELPGSTAFTMTFCPRNFSPSLYVISTLHSLVFL